MRNVKRAAAVVLATALTICVGTTTVSAATLSELRDQISDKKSELAEGKEQEQSLSSRLNELEAAISENEVKLVSLEGELKEAEAEVETQTQNLNDRVRNMYKSGSVGFLDVLLGSGSFSEFLTNLDLVKRIYTSDSNVLADLQKAKEKVEKKKQEVETLQLELKKSQDVVRKEKERIAASNAETAKMLSELQSEADKLTAELRKRQSTGSYSGGVMAWPVPASHRITDTYHWRAKEPITGISAMHTGVDIGAPYGSAIVAANSGTVIYAGRKGSYGNAVMIDHGGGIVTLYGHCSSIHVSVGQKVSRGQTVASVGSTGNSTGNHCHFEVRVNGGHVNPLPYIS